MRALMEHDWPGNIRELRNVVERATITSGDSGIIGQEHLGLSTVSTKIGVELKFDHEPTIDELRRTYLAQLLEQHSGHRGHIASILGVSERNIYRLVKRLGLDHRELDSASECEHSAADMSQVRDVSL